MKGRLITAALLFWLACPAGAQDAGSKKPARKNPPARVRPLRLTLKDVALLAFRNNPAVRRGRLDPIAAEGSLRKAKAEFDPKLFGSATHTYEETDSSSTTGTSSIFSLFGSSGEKTETYSSLFEVGLRKKIRTGGTLELVYNAQRTKTSGGDSGGLSSFFASSLNPSWTNRVELRFSQPLLQGFGVEFNMAAIRIAELQKKVARLSLEDTVRKTVAQALTTYWDLALAIRDKEIQVQSLGRAQELLKLNEERLKQGLVSKLDVLRARVGVAQRREQIIRINQTILDAEDQLKKLILPQDEVFYRQVTVLPTEGLDYKTVRLHLPDLVRTALVGRPDYKRAKQQFRQRYLGYRQARNGLLPRLDFKGRVGYEGTKGSFSAANSKLWEFDLLNWELGLVVEVPLGNRAAKGEVQKSWAELRQAQIDIEDLEKEIVRDVRQQARAVATALQRIASSKESRDLTHEQLTKELERFKQGKSTNKIVLDYEEDLAREQLRFLRAVIAYKQALVALAGSQGVVVQQHLGEQPASRKYSRSRLGPEGGKASK